LGTQANDSLDDCPDFRRPGDRAEQAAAGKTGGEPFKSSCWADLFGFALTWCRLARALHYFTPSRGRFNAAHPPILKETDP
jgi:hypothetical protein